MSLIAILIGVINAQHNGLKDFSVLFLLLSTNHNRALKFYIVSSFLFGNFLTWTSFLNFVLVEHVSGTYEQAKGIQ